MKVCLINPPSPFLQDQSVHGPLGLWYLGATLKDAGHHVIYADLGLRDAIPEADAYGITGTTPQLGAMQRIVADLHAERKYVIVGGAHATLCPQDMEDVGADVVVCGEGDQIMLPALQDPFIFGAVYPPRIKDLDSLPFPDRSQSRRYKYYVTDRVGNQREATTIITSRGCPNTCAFCCHALWKQFYRCRSAENVIAEVRDLREIHGYDALHFFDDSIAINPRRLLAICQGIKPLGVVWRAFVRADQVSPGLLQAMADAGCIEIGLGVESGDQRILDNIQKGETVEQQALAVQWAHEARLRVKVFIIVGLPGEDWLSIDRTALFFDRTKPDSADIVILQVYRGSPIGDNPAAFGIELTDGPSYYKTRKGEHTCHHRTKIMSSDDLLIARDYLAARFNCV